MDDPSLVDGVVTLHPTPANDCQSVVPTHLMFFSFHSDASPKVASPKGSWFIRALLLGVSYILSARLGLLLALPDPARITLIWLPSGIAMAAYFRWGLRYWPIVFLAAALLKETSFQVKWPLAGLLVVGQTVAPLVAAWLLRRVRFCSDFNRRRDILFFTGITGVSMTIAPLLGMITLCLAGKVPLAEFFSKGLYWWMGDWMGALVAAPLLVSMSWQNWNKLLTRKHEWLICAISSTALMVGVFFFNSGQQSLPLIFIPFFLTIWAALRLGVTATALGVLALAATASAATAMSRGPFLELPESLAALMLWAYLITATVFNLMITGIEIAQKQAQATLLESQKRLNQLNRELALAVERAEALALEANAANRIKTEFLSNISHEIRTPLNGVIGMTDLLLQSPLDETQRQYAKAVSACSENLLRLIDDLLDFSKMGMGKLSLKPHPFKLSDVIHQTFCLVRPVQKETTKLTHSIAPGTPDDLHGDSGRLGQILLNFVHNALKFTEKGNVHLHVEVESESGNTVTLKFSVKDTGIGISEEWLKQLFNPFVQVDSSSTRRFGGAGLGLAISKKLAQLMGGNIGATSELGKGSTFWVTAVFEKVNPANASVPSDAE